MEINAFSPTGLTVSFTAAASAPTAVQAVSANPVTRPTNRYRVTNSGAFLALLGVGATEAAARAAAASLAAGAVPILAGTTEVLGFPVGSHFSGTTLSSTSVVYVTPGEGI
jgi:hypothetical protein